MNHLDDCKFTKDLQNFAAPKCADAQMSTHRVTAPECHVALRVVLKSRSVLLLPWVFSLPITIFTKSTLLHLFLLLLCQCFFSFVLLFVLIRITIFLSASCSLFLLLFVAFSCLHFSAGAL